MQIFLMNAIYQNRHASKFKFNHCVLDVLRKSSTIQKEMSEIGATLAPAPAQALDLSIYLAEAEADYF